MFCSYLMIALLVTINISVNEFQGSLLPSALTFGAFALFFLLCRATYLSGSSLSGHCLSLLRNSLLLSIHSSLDTPPLLPVALCDTSSGETLPCAVLVSQEQWRRMDTWPLHTALSLPQHRGRPGTTDMLTRYTGRLKHKDVWCEWFNVFIQDSVQNGVCYPACGSSPTPATSPPPQDSAPGDVQSGSVSV